MRALQWLYGQYGQELSLEIWGQCIGTAHEFDPVVHLFELAKPDSTLEELYEARWQRFESFWPSRALCRVVRYLERAKIWI